MKQGPIAFGFANIGRGNREQTREAVRLIAAQMLPPERAVMLFNEADEADMADEHGLISSAFRHWEDHAWSSREPILTKGLRSQWSNSFLAASGVPRQSPTRLLHEVILDGGDGPDIAALGGHYPAGAKNGKRPARVKAQLMVQYMRMFWKHRKRVRHHHEKGRHVVWAMDVNWRGFPRWFRGQETLAKHGPDLMVVLPAPGWEVRVPSRGHVELPIEALHRLEWAYVAFHRKQQ